MYNLCTVTNVKALTQQSVGYAGHDDLIRVCIEQSSAMVFNYIKRDLIRKVRNEIFMTPDGNNFSVILRETPIVAAEPMIVTYDRSGYHERAASYIVLSKDTDYRVDYDTGRIELSGDFLYSPRGLKVTYTGGYAVDEADPTLLQVPANLKQATAIQAAFLLRRILEQSTGVSSQMKEGTSMTSFNASAQAGLIPEAASLLGSTKRAMVGRS